MAEQGLLIGAQAQEEVEAEVLVGVERIVGDEVAVRVEDYGRHRFGRQLAVAEEHEAVAALEARFVLHGDVVARKARTGFVGKDVVEAGLEVAGMSATAYAFAMG